MTNEISDGAFEDFRHAEFEALRENRIEPKLFFRFRDRLLGTEEGTDGITVAHGVQPRRLRTEQQAFFRAGPAQSPCPATIFPRR